MMRIQRSADGEFVIFALSGRIEVEELAELQRLFKSEANNQNLVLDLKDVRLDGGSGGLQRLGREREPVHPWCSNYASSIQRTRLTKICHAWPVNFVK